VKKILFTVIIGAILIGGLYIANKQIQKNGAPSLLPVHSVPNQQISPTTGTTPSGTMQEQAIQVTASGFSPQSVTIKAGTKVTWTNTSGSMIVIASNPHPVHTDYPPLNLGSLANGQSVSLVFPTPGTYGYHNHLNPSQTGTIIVQ